jgi:hypothetical protein
MALSSNPSTAKWGKKSMKEKKLVNKNSGHSLSLDILLSRVNKQAKWKSTECNLFNRICSNYDVRQILNDETK